VDVFFVGSPLEYVNALEARARFGVPRKEALLVVLQTYELGREGGDLQLLAAIEREQWADVRIFVRPRSSPLEALRVQRAIARLAEALGPVERVFFGGYLSTVRRDFVNRLACRERILLDEGSSTLEVVDLRRRRGGDPRFRASGERLNFPRRRDRLLRGGLLRHRLMRLLGVRDEHPGELTYFSVYDLDPPGSDRVVANDYRHLRARVEERPVSQDVLVLGGPLWEERIAVSLDVNLRVLEGIRRHYPGARLLYKPHRHESPAKVARVRDELGYELLHSDLPVELWLLRCSERPRALVGIYTSALATCARLFGPDLDLVAAVLPPEWLGDTYRDHAARIVDDLRRTWGPRIELLPVASRAA